MQTPNLSLYYFDGCPYCARVRSAIDRLGLDVELRDIQRDSAHRRDLVEATGRQTVPCLRIDRPEGTRWMHESLDIVRYLESEISAA